MPKFYNFLLWEVFFIRRKTKADIFISVCRGIVKDLIKKIKPQRKIYQYGSVFHFNYDNPTLIELINKYLCDKIFDKPKEYKRYSQSIYDLTRTQAVKTFFDYSTGQWQDRGSRKYQEYLKSKGKVIMGEEEAEQEARKNKLRNEREREERDNNEYINTMERYFKQKNINPADVMRAIERQGGYNG